MRDIEDDRDQRERRFRLLYEEHYRSIQAYAVRRVGPADDAADVVADTLRAWPWPEWQCPAWQSLRPSP